MNMITQKSIQFLFGRGHFIFLFFSMFFAHSATATLICPPQVSVDLDQCDLLYTMNYNIVQWSSTVPLADTTYSPFPGTFLPPGNHTGTIIGTDFNGDNSVCNFIISVIQPPSIAVCNNNVQVNLQTDCNEPITPEMILSPSSSLCGSDALIQVQTQLGQILGVGNPVPANVDWIGQGLIVSISDLQSNTSCSTSLEVTAPTVLHVVCPPDITVSCVEPNDPSITGEPNVQTCFEQPELIISYEDFVGVQFCPSPLSYITTRSWTVQNPIGEKETCQHKITGKRFQLVEVVFPPNFDGTQQPSLECIDGLSASEVADTSITGIPTISGYSADQSICDFSANFEDVIVPLCGESYQIQREWTITDLCTSQTRKQTQVIEIQDSQAPIFMIPDTIWVSSNLDCGNEADLPSATILEECSDLTYLIQTPWSSIFTNGGLAFIQQTNGIHNITYSLTDGCGNASSQTAILVVNPQTLVSCPSNMSIDCNHYLEELKAPLSIGDLSVLDQFGDAEFHANCDPDISETIQINVDECGFGMIERTIETTNFSFPQSCVQQINVQHNSNFVVSFPRDTFINCSNSPQNFGEPQVFGSDCEQIAISFTDQIFNVVPDACYRIIRTWQVINPCIYNPNFGNQTIESSEADLGGANCDLDGNGTCDVRTFQDGVNTANFPNAQPDGYIEYQQEIKVNDGFAPEFLPYVIDPICVTNNNCGALVNIPVPEILDCSEVDVIASSDLGSGFGPFVGIPPGIYNITFSAVDLCGNTTTIQRQLPVLDCQKPEAVCNTGQIIELINPNQPMIEVFAAELNGGSFDNCSGNPTYSFSSNINNNSVTFDCNDLGLNNFFMYVTDEAGNQDFCQGVVNIQDNINGCPSGPGGNEIDGEIKTQHDDGVGKVIVNYETSSGIMNFVETDDNGLFNIPISSNITTITPKKNINILNGVTTFDIVLMQKHILFVQTLDNPYDLIAADINNTGTITVSDAVAMKKVILFIDDEFPNNESWRFVDADFVFSNPSNPWIVPFPESKSVNSNQPPFEADFVGIKIGDLNGNVDPLNYQQADDRNFKGTVNFSVPNIEFEKGETIAIPFTLQENNISGYQFTLEFDEQILAFSSLKEGRSNQEDFGMSFIENGFLTSSWTGEVIEAQEVMFTLLFETKDKGYLKDLIRLNSTFTPKEAYSKELELLNIQLKIESQFVSDRLILYQNQPNPFSELTNIEFFLPIDSDIRLAIYDSAGQLVKTVHGFYQKGINRIEIKGKELIKNGVYYFQISTENQVETGKMILIN